MVVKPPLSIHSDQGKISSSDLEKNIFLCCYINMKSKPFILVLAKTSLAVLISLSHGVIHYNTSSNTCYSYDYSHEMYLVFT